MRMNPLRAKEEEALLIRFAGRPVIALRVFRPGKTNPLRSAWRAMLVYSRISARVQDAPSAAKVLRGVMANRSRRGVRCVVLLEEVKRGEETGRLSMLAHSYVVVGLREATGSL